MSKRNTDGFLTKGKTKVRCSGFGGTGQTSDDQTEAVIRKTIDRGIHVFTLRTAGAVHTPFGRAIAAKHNTKLSLRTDTCLYCSHCESPCPLDVKQEYRMEQINNYFKEG